MVKRNKENKGKWRLPIALLISLTFVVTYFFVVVSFFEGWQTVRIFNSIPDLIVAFVALTILIFSLKFKNFKVRNYLVWGTTLIVIGKFIELPLQEYAINVQNLSSVFWAPSKVFILTGFFLILSAFKEGANGN